MEFSLVLVICVVSYFFCFRATFCFINPNCHLIWATFPTNYPGLANLYCISQNVGVGEADAWVPPVPSCRRMRT
jgi:hypothetical protein